MKNQISYSLEVRERAVRLVFEHHPFADQYKEQYEVEPICRQIPYDHKARARS